MAFLRKNKLFVIFWLFLLVTAILATVLLNVQVFDSRIYRAICSTRPHASQLYFPTMDRYGTSVQCLSFFGEDQYIAVGRGGMWGYDIYASNTNLPIAIVKIPAMTYGLAATGKSGLSGVFQNHSKKEVSYLRLDFCCRTKKVNTISSDVRDGILDMVYGCRKVSRCQEEFFIVNSCGYTHICKDGIAPFYDITFNLADCIVNFEQSLCNATNAVLLPNNYIVHDVLLHDDLAIISLQNLIYVFSISKQEVLKKFEMESKITSLICFNAEKILVGCQDGNISVVHRDDFGWAFNRICEIPKSIQDIFSSPCNQYLAVYCYEAGNSFMYFLSINNPSDITQLQYSHSFPHTAAFSHSGDKIAVGMKNGDVVVWNVADCLLRE